MALKRCLHCFFPSGAIIFLFVLAVFTFVYLTLHARRKLNSTDSTTTSARLIWKARFANAMVGKLKPTALDQAHILRDSQAGRDHRKSLSEV
jgi:hypothetical protein